MKDLEKFEIASENFFSKGDDEKRLTFEVVLTMLSSGTCKCATRAKIGDVTSVITVFLGTEHDARTQFEIQKSKAILMLNN